jgi:hypothetical protein
MSQRIKQLIFICLMAVCVVSTAVQAEGIKFKSFEMEKVDGEWLLNTAFQIELTPGLEDAIQKGVVLYFQVDFELMRARWYWFDEKAIFAQRQIRLFYQPLTQQYRIASEGLSFSAKNLTEALQAVGTIGGWRVIEANQLDPNRSYAAGFRMFLDLSKLPKPFQVNALNNRDWNISSDWYRFPFSTNGPNLNRR